jgi:hypothetical protein
MKNSSSKIIKIAQKSSTSSLSKAQKLFNRLIKKIDLQRQQLRDWQSTTPLYQQKYASDYEPLLAAYNEHRTQLVYVFDRAYQDRFFSKKEKEKLAYLISNIAGDLLVNKDNPELKVIFNKYNDTDFDTQNDETKADVKTMLEQLFGMEIDRDIDITRPEAMLRLMAEKAQEWHAQEDAAQQADEGKRKKSAKQLAREAKREEEEKNVSQSIREVYRKLASALHPDREPDAAERKRKTDLMQRVNVAYADKDLLQLLELQLELEQIDQTMINTISEDRLRHYNQILTEQSHELELEIEQKEFAFRLRYQIEPYCSVTPAFMLPGLERDIIELQQDINEIAQDLHDFEQPQHIKSWLKTYRIPQAPMLDFLADADLSQMWRRM